jgi:hypothetical protein
VKRFVLVALLLVACEDPVHDDKVDALGPEPGPYPQGPLHRAGQPCTVCHGGKGPGDPTFDLAGTVFRTPNDRQGVVGAKVVLYDREGNTDAYFTNDVGTFIAEEGDLTLDFPLWVAIEADGKRVRMETPIFRETACGACHADPTSPSSVGHVYLEESP